MDASTETPPASRNKSWVAAIVVLVLAVGAGVGGYFVGKSSGEDLDAARAEGEVAGEKEGAAEGAEEGFAAGFKEGREKGFDETYADAYRSAYQRAFKEEDLDPPAEDKIDVPDAEAQPNQ
jgi:hypothetical protein